MFSKHCAEPCCQQSVLDINTIILLPQPFITYMHRMAEQDIICTRFRNIYQCGSLQRKNVFKELCGTMHISICTQANHATDVAPTVYDISDKNGRAGCDMHTVPQYLLVRYVTEENCFQRIVRNAADINPYSS